MKTPTLPTHLILSKSDQQLKRVPVAVETELQYYIDQARVQGMQ